MALKQKREREKTKNRKQETRKRVKGPDQEKNREMIEIFVQLKY